MNDKLYFCLRTTAHNPDDLRPDERALHYSVIVDGEKMANDRDFAEFIGKQIGLAYQYALKTELDKI